jgi:hypothetical protein
LFTGPRRAVAPRAEALTAARSFDRSSRVLVFDLLALGGSVAGFDRDPTRLHRLRHLAHQVDLQQTIFE